MESDTLVKDSVSDSGTIRNRGKIEPYGKTHQLSSTPRSRGRDHAKPILREEKKMAVNQLPIETRSLRIRPFEVQDTSAVFILNNEETARTWIPSQVFNDCDHARSVLQFLISQYSSPGNPRLGPYVLAIEHRADSALIGHVGFSPFDDEVEIGFAIAQDYQRQGFATEAIVAGSHWVLKTFALDRILAITSAVNTASKRTLERAQFSFEGNKTMLFQGTEQEVSIYTLSAKFR